MHAGQVLGQLGGGDIGGDVAGEEAGQQRAEGGLSLAGGRFQAEDAGAQAEGFGDPGQHPRARRIGEQAGDNEDSIAAIAGDQVVLRREGQCGLSHSAIPS